MVDSKFGKDLKKFLKKHAIGESLALADAKVSTWRMPLEGEDGMGIWHDRYYVPGTSF